MSKTVHEISLLFSKSTRVTGWKAEVRWHIWRCNVAGNCVIRKYLEIWLLSFIVINFMFSPCIFKVNHFYLPTNALDCIEPS